MMTKTETPPSLRTFEEQVRMALQAAPEGFFSAGEVQRAINGAFRCGWSRGAVKSYLELLVRQGHAEAKPELFERDGYLRAGTAYGWKVGDE